MKTRHHQPGYIARGRSLIEMMIAILIGSLVLAGVLIIASGSITVGRRADSLGGLSDTGQTALQLLSADVRMAGYSLPRTYFVAGYETKMLSTAGIRGCDAGFTDNSVAQFNALSCKTGTSASGGAMSISYEADEFNSILVTNSAGALVPSDCRGTGLVALTGLKGNTERPMSGQDSMSTSPAYWRVENRYYIANSSTDGEPTLFCLGNGGASPGFGAGQSPQALVRGVERMVLSYGVAIGAIEKDKSEAVLVIGNPSVATYMSASAIDTKWIDETPDVRWQRVVSVRVCLETRGDVGSIEKITDSQNPSFINCDGVATEITDKRARRAVRMTMNLRNRTTAVDKITGIGLGGV
ncbi:MAG TPA: PilW family protein [Candidatus Aquabacterium excrementipullorum]|nr:PilW family protein [Candidatus Aquabacterium excrementipullorum]